MLSMLVELSNPANSLKSLFNIRVLGKPLLSQHFDSGNSLLNRSGQPIITVAYRPVKGHACHDLFH